MAEYALGTAVTSPTEQYVYGSYIDEPVVKLGGTGRLIYYHRNQQFSITGVTNTSGSIVEHYAYDAYGNMEMLDSNLIPVTISAVSNRLSFTGRRCEPDLGAFFPSKVLPF